jgi:type I restriction enzyme, S subunit
MASEWPRVRLETIAASDRKGFAMGPFGSNIKSENYQPNGVPVLRGVNLGDGGFSGNDLVFLSEKKAEELRNSQAFPYDLVFVAQGTVGKVGLVPNTARFQKTVLSQNLMKFSCDSAKADSRFLYYFFISSDGQQTIRSRVNPTGVPCISRPLSSLKEFEVTLPPLAEQKAIAGILGALDDKIELNRRMNATLEAMAQAMFQSWFVDFDPVRAKLDGRQSPGLDPATAALFPNEFEDSELGHIPKGWSVTPVGKIVDCVGGGTPSTAEPKYWEGGTHHWTTPKDFSSLQAPILLDTDRKLTDAGIAKISSGMLPAGTLLLSSRAPVGYLAIAAMPVAINQGFIALKCNERASNFFMLNWCQSNMAEIEGRATGTTFAEISKHNFRPIPVVLPPKDLMSAFTAKVAPLYTQITASLQQARTLAALRDTLLPRLLSGELGVIEGEKEVSA